MVFKSRGREARAMLWTADDGKKYLDRIYPYDTPCIDFIRLWMKDNGVLSIYNGRGLDGLMATTPITVTYRNVCQLDYYPYVDSLSYMTYSRKNNELKLFSSGADSEKYEDDADNGVCFRAELCSTDGGCCEY